MLETKIKSPSLEHKTGIDLKVSFFEGFFSVDEKSFS